MHGYNLYSDYVESLEIHNDAGDEQMEEDYAFREVSNSGNNIDNIDKQQQNHNKDVDQ